MFLKNKNIIFKIRRSKVTGYAALSQDNCKPVFRNSDHVRLKSACSAIETARKLKFPIVDCCTFKIENNKDADQTA